MPFRSHWDIGKVYKRLILGIAKERGIDVIDALIAAYNSFVSDKIDDYNSSFYYDNPQSILQTFFERKARIAKYRYMKQAMENHRLFSFHPKSGSTSAFNLS